MANPACPKEKTASAFSWDTRFLAGGPQGFVSHEQFEFSPFMGHASRFGKAAGTKSTFLAHTTPYALRNGVGIKEASGAWAVDG
ncbi:hypothetical protein PAXINDRAFT_22112 [Paxillus involutus ATCC 200175]|uniref:Uncharacterized protein n=1 Tax=Paxillus involutus ATCC 200175 TaxID=664439 RepID=A0A0C9SLK7_PAXIN|nr:hypothetical protein PAXINDRAFT_22112 [Paxillus involutus ATCC 200175]